MTVGLVTACIDGWDMACGLIPLDSKKIVGGCGACTEEDIMALLNGSQYSTPYEEYLNDKGMFLPKGPVVIQQGTLVREVPSLLVKPAPKGSLIYIPQNKVMENKQPLLVPSQINVFEPEAIRSQVHFRHR